MEKYLYHRTVSGLRPLIILPLLIVMICAGVAHAGFNLDNIKKGAKKLIEKKAGLNNKSLSNGEISQGLREALTVGIKNAASTASKVNGYYKNPRIRIPFPPEAKKVKTAAETLGMEKQVNDFVRALNRAAEEAAKGAAPIFMQAIKQMSIQDGFAILNGPNDAATVYLRKTTTSPLRQKFRPVVKRAIQKVHVTKYWNPIATNYNQLPLVKKVNPNLDAYVTDRALRGLFKLIASEERKIRKNPSARVTALLRRVFE
jgi:hypothetical protein